MDAPENEPVGSLSEEASKLLNALQGWAEDTGKDYAGAAASAAGGAAGAASWFSEHIATGGTECTLCPLCRAIAAVRGTSPEVRDHLGAAASSLVQAVAGLLATEVPDPPRRQRGPKENIDVSDDEREDD